MPDMLKMLKHFESAIPKLKKALKKGYSEEEMKEYEEDMESEDMQMMMMEMPESEAPMRKKRKKMNHNPY
jgi:murein L,D-transpeptidase YafK